MLFLNAIMLSEFSCQLNNWMAFYILKMAIMASLINNFLQVAYFVN